MTERTSKLEDDTLRFKTAGYSATERLSVSVGVCRCAHIADGVAFWHDDSGAWVVSYADLMTITEAATASRTRKLVSDRADVKEP